MAVCNVPRLLGSILSGVLFLIEADKFMQVSKAISSNDLAAVKRYFQYVNINLIFPNTLETPLHIAAKHGSIDVAKFFLEFSDIDIESLVNKATPLYVASLYRQKEMISLLIDRGAQVLPGPQLAPPILHVNYYSYHKKYVFFLYKKSSFLRMKSGIHVENMWEMQKKCFH